MIPLSPMSQFKNGSIKKKIFFLIALVPAIVIFMELFFGVFTMLKLAQDNLDIWIAIFTLIFVPTILIIVVELCWKIFGPIAEMAYHAAKSEGAKSITTEITQSANDSANSFIKTLKLDIGKISGEMGRLKFICYNLIGLVLISPMLQTVFNFTIYDWIDLFIVGPLVFLATYIFYKLVIIPCAKRAVSLGVNPWLALALLIPAINIPVYVFMVFAPKGAAQKLKP